MKEYPVLGKKDTRSGFGDGLYELGQQNEDVVAIIASKRTGLHLAPTEFSPLELKRM